MSMLLANLRAVWEIDRRGDIEASFTFKIVGDLRENRTMLWPLVRFVHETGYQVLPAHHKFRVSELFTDKKCCGLAYQNPVYFEDDRAIRLLVRQAFVSFEQNRSCKDLWSTTCANIVEGWVEGVKDKEKYPNGL